MRFSNQTVLITGASLGVGRACARAFHAEGARVVLLARREGPLLALQQELGSERTLVLTADVADNAALATVVGRTVDHFGGLDGLVNNGMFGLTVDTDSVDRSNVAKAHQDAFVEAYHDASAPPNGHWNFHVGPQLQRYGITSG